MEVVLDESLEIMARAGCEDFGDIVKGLVNALCIQSIEGYERPDHFGRLTDICNFMLEGNALHLLIRAILEKDTNEMINIVELGMDGTLWEQVESMIRGSFYFVLIL